MTVLERCKILGLDLDSSTRSRIGEKIKNRFELLNKDTPVERVEEIQTVSVRKYPDSFHEEMDSIIQGRVPIETKKRSRAIKVKTNG